MDYRLRGDHYIVISSTHHYAYCVYKRKNILHISLCLLYLFNILQ